jgi:hypothetical protein
LLTLLLVAGCVKSGSAQLQVDLLEAENADTPDRADCAEIYGTAFRSETERTWFEENCSRWPLVDVPETRPSTPPPANNSARNRDEASPTPQAGDRQNCDEIRGTRYRSAAERSWYQENCGANQQQSSGPDRTNCNEIRGTTYRSHAERAWFQANCGAGSSPSGGPDRTSCSAIRGTTYRSDAERAWYQANCQANADDGSDNQLARGNDDN